MMTTNESSANLQARLSLQPHMPSSYFCNSVGALHDWLVVRGWESISTSRNPHEYARLRTRDHAIVVLYHSGAVVVQGQHHVRTRTLLAPLVVAGV